MYYSSQMSGGHTLAAEIERVQRELQSFFGDLRPPASIRASARGAFPALNVASTPTTVEIFAFAPGLDPQSIDVSVDRGVLTLSGERESAIPRPDSNGSAADGNGATYASERFAGSFKRAVALPDYADVTQVDAVYRDGILHVTVPRQVQSQPRRIEVK